MEIFNNNNNNNNNNNGFIQKHWMAILQTRELKNWKTQVTKVII